MGDLIKQLSLAVIVVMPMLTGMTWAQGLIAEDPAELAALPHIPPYRAFLPIRKDLSAGFPLPGNQGDQGSCVAWSVGYALRTYYDHLRRHTSMDDANNIFSPAFVYNLTIREKGNCDSGSRLSDALKLLQTAGISSLAEFPYDSHSCSRVPGPTVLAHARQFSIFGFAALRQGNVDDAKGRIAAGHPVVIGMRLDNRRMTDLEANEIYDEDATDPDGGHAVVLVGYDDTLQAFKFVNSWGSKWADHGFGMMSYRIYSSNVDAAFSITDLPPEPPPTPKPSPPVVGAPWQDSLYNVTSALTCARVTVQAADPLHGTVSGFVGSDADLVALKQAIARLPGNVAVTSEVVVRPWPQCEALITLEKVSKTHRGLEATTVDHSSGAFVGGDRLILRIRTPAYPSYLYVTYLQATGDAVQLYQPPGQVPTALAPNTTIVLGGDSDRWKYRIGPPFGREMLVVIAAASPLFADGLKASVIEREYLSALRKALLYKPDPKQPDRVLDVATIFLTTLESAKP